MFTPFDVDIQKFNKKFVNIYAELFYGLVNPHRKLGEENNYQELGLFNFYGVFSVTEDLNVINVHYDSIMHPFFENNASDFYRLQIFQPGAGLIVLFNYQRYTSYDIELEKDQFQAKKFGIKEIRIR